MSDLKTRLTEFVERHGFTSTGSLCVALVITEKAKNAKFPLDSDSFVSERSGGQVTGLSSEAVQRILRRHGITRELSKMGGRTNRGSINNMRDYVALLNSMCQDRLLDLEAVERFWINQVLTYFASKPFKLRVDPSKGLRVAVRDVLEQARERQAKASGAQFAGAVMQHLVGAKLACALRRDIKHHSFSTSDAQTSRAGDFLIGNTAIHVTTTPSEGVIKRCQENLEKGLRPVVVTSAKGAGAVDQLAENVGISNRIDVFEIEQFVALNIYELGGFSTEAERSAISQIIDKYNEIIQQCELDQSLRIEP